MTIIFEILLWTGIYFAVLMIGFPLVMVVRARVNGTVLEQPAKILVGLPYLAADILFNWTVMPLWFPFDWPETVFETTTTRLRRYKKFEEGRRLEFATWACEYLNQFDPGHC